MSLPRQSNFDRLNVENLVVKNNLTVLGTETINNQVINQNSISVDEITHRNTTVLAIGNTATTQVTVDGTLFCNDHIETLGDLTVAGSSKFSTEMYLVEFVERSTMTRTSSSAGACANSSNSVIFTPGIV